MPCRHAVFARRPPPEADRSELEVYRRIWQLVGRTR
jgi:hypothetical protein